MNESPRSPSDEELVNAVEEWEKNTAGSIYLLKVLMLIFLLQHIDLPVFNNINLLKVLIVNLYYYPHKFIKSESMVIFVLQASQHRILTAYSHP